MGHQMTIAGFTNSIMKQPFLKMWRQFRNCQILKLLLLALLSFSLISACNGDTAENKSVTANCRPIQHAMGETCVPAEPERVVVMAGTEIELVVGLGVMPVGAAIGPAPDFIKDRLAGVKDVGWPEPNLETILSLKPDVILSTTGRVGQIYEQLSRIAPTVLTEFKNSYQWKSELRLFAKALGKTERAEQILNDYYQRTKQLKAQLGEPEERPEVSVVDVRAESISLGVKNSFSGSVLEDAGIPRPPSQDEKRNISTISLESIEAMDGDVMFLYTYGGSGAESTLADLKAHPLWSKLDVVQRDRVYEVPGYWIGRGPISANLVLDDLFKYLIQEES